VWVATAEAEPARMHYAKAKLLLTPFFSFAISHSDRFPMRFLEDPQFTTVGLIGETLRTYYYLVVQLSTTRRRGQGARAKQSHPRMNATEADLPT